MFFMKIVLLVSENVSHIDKASRPHKDLKASLVVVVEDAELQVNSIRIAPILARSCYVYICL